MTLLLLTGPAALLIAFISSTTTAEEVAARVAPEVFRQLVGESRAQRALNCRADLGVANEVLIGRNLPPVADPGAGANAEQVCTRASSAQVFSKLPDEIAGRLIDEATDGQLVLPLPDGPTAPATPGAAGSGSGPPGQDPAAPAPPGGTSTTPSSGQPTPAPAPAPAPPSDDGGLLPRLVPIPIPRLLQPLLSA